MTFRKDTDARRCLIKKAIADGHITHKAISVETKIPFSRVVMHCLRLREMDEIAIIDDPKRRQDEPYLYELVEVKQKAPILTDSMTMAEFMAMPKPKLELHELWGL